MLISARPLDVLKCTSHVFERDERLHRIEPDVDHPRSEAGVSLRVMEPRLSKSPTEFSCSGANRPIVSVTSRSTEKARKDSSVLACQQSIAAPTPHAQDPSAEVGLTSDRGPA